jgi:hypothetical protein
MKTVVDLNLSPSDSESMNTTNEDEDEEWPEESTVTDSYIPNDILGLVVMERLGVQKD